MTRIESNRPSPARSQSVDQATPAAPKADATPAASDPARPTPAGVADAQTAFTSDGARKPVIADKKSFGSTEKKDKAAFFKTGAKAVKADAKALQNVPGALDNNGLAADAPNAASAAARLMNPENYSGPEGQHNRARDFMELAQKQPGFMGDVYKTLGADESKKLLDQAVGTLHNDNANDYPDDKSISDKTKALAQSMAQMPEAMQREVAQKAAADPYTAGSLATVLKQPGAPAAARATFVESMKDQALQDPNAARALGDVMASDQNLVNHYTEQWGADTVKNLVNKGLETPVSGGSFHYDSAQWPSLNNNGIEKMVGMLGAFNGTGAADLKTGLFNDLTAKLKDSKTGDSRNQDLVNGLKDMFKGGPQAQPPQSLAASQEMLQGLYSRYGDHASETMSTFMRDAMFGNPKDAATDPFVQHTQQFMNELRNQMLSPDNVARRTDQNEATLGSEDYAKMLGRFTGAMSVGFGMAVKDNKNTEEARKALVEATIGLVADRLPTKGVPGADAIKSQLEKLVTDKIGGFLTQDLRADRGTMTNMMQGMLDIVGTQAADFDRRNLEAGDPKNFTQTDVQFKLETMWGPFINGVFN